MGIQLFYAIFEWFLYKVKFSRNLERISSLCRRNTSSYRYYTIAKGRCFMQISSYRGKLQMLGIMVFATVILNAVLLFYIISYNNEIKEIDYPSANFANEMKYSVIQVQQYLSDISATRAMDGKDDGFQNAEENAQSFRESLQSFIKLHPENEKSLKEYGQSFEEYYILGKKMAQAYIDGGPSEGNKLMDSFDTKADALSEFTDKIHDESAEILQAKLERIDQQTKIVFVILILSGLINVCTAFFLVRSIFKAFQILEQGIQKDNQGKITLQEIRMDRQDEFGHFASLLNILLDQVRKFIGQVSDSSQQLTASAQELTSTVDQSSGTSMQVVSSTEKLVHGADVQLQNAKKSRQDVIQMSDAIVQIAENTQKVSNAAEKTSTNAAAGEQSIREVIAQMQIIEKKTDASVSSIELLENKSGQIGKIVEVISSIANQTNLLALNAAIESARAGEAGRGFSIVAEEVRKLAEQSQDAAKQITELIAEVQSSTSQAANFMQESKIEVDAGARIVDNAGKNFTEIVQMVLTITQQIHEISASVEESNNHSQEIVTSMQVMEKESQDAAGQAQTISASTQEQSASLEEIAASSQHLAKMADDLQQAIYTFRL